MENLLEIFFLSKVPEFLHVAFKLMGKHCSVFFIKNLDRVHHWLKFYSIQVDSDGRNCHGMNGPFWS